MIFVDGGHDLRTLKSDTENSFKMIPDDRMACISWHDYGSEVYPQVTEYLEELSNEYEIYHVEDTMICFYLANKDESIVIE